MTQGLSLGAMRSGYFVVRFRAGLPLRRLGPVALLEGLAAATLISGESKLGKGLLRQENPPPPERRCLARPGYR